MAGEIWLPSRGLAVSLTNYNHGLVRLARIIGPSGEAGITAPSNDHLRTWILEVVEGELRIMFDELDELGRAERSGVPFPGRTWANYSTLPKWAGSAEPGRILCPVCNLSHPPDAPRCRNCGAVNPDGA